MLQESSKSDVCMCLATKERRVNGANRRQCSNTLPSGTVTDEWCLSPLVSHCPQCHGHRRVCLTIPVDDPGDIYRDKARVSLAARRAIDKDVAPK